LDDVSSSFTGTVARKDATERPNGKADARPQDQRGLVEAFELANGMDETMTAMKYCRAS
jgi:hypothetical protein